MNHFPLLQKELLEQSAKKKTYIIRMAFAIVFYGLFFTSWYSNTSGANWEVYGKGRSLITSIFIYQFVCIFAFVPPFIANIIASEKENGTLQLLLISRLRTGEIIIEKLLGHLLPMLSLLLMTIPALAISYSLGGITPETVFYGIWAELICAVQVSAIALMCSCYCITSTRSLLLSYFFGLCFYTFLFFSNHPNMLFPPYIFLGEFDSNFSQTKTSLVIAAVFTLVFIFFASLFLTRYAFVKPKNRLRILFFGIDNILGKLNRKIGNIELLKQRSLPEDRPVYWREVHTKTLGKFHYKFRVFLALQVPLCTFLLLGKNFGVLHWASEVLFFIAMVTISMVSAHSVAVERERQTLDILLTTPISSKEIILQKMASINILVWIFILPLFTATLSKAFSYFAFHSLALPYFLFSAVAIIVDFLMIRWVMLWVGLKAKKKSMATLLVFIILTLWYLLSRLSLYFFLFLGFICVGLPWLIKSKVQKGKRTSLMIITPWTLLFSFVLFIAFTMNRGYLGYGILYSMFYLGVYSFFKRKCLEHCDLYLGRIDNPKHLGIVK